MVFESKGVKNIFLKSVGDLEVMCAYRKLRSGDSYHWKMHGSGKCMALENTREFIKMGAPMTEEMCCAGCRNFYANFAKSMGFINADFIRTDDGCRYVYSKI